jgi:beta-galactosidase
MALDLSGRDAWLAIDPDAIALRVDSPLTLECWFYANRYEDRTGLVAKTESSDYGFFVNNGRPSWSILLGPTYLELEADEPILETGRWHHIAGVYDGAESRLYVDGKLIKSARRTADRRANSLPLIVGADVNGAGAPTSFFDDWIDGVRLSKSARYRGASFTPARRPGADGETLLLLNMDGAVGPWAYDESDSRAHPTLKGGAAIAPAPK